MTAFQLAKKRENFDIMKVLVSHMTNNENEKYLTS